MVSRTAMLPILFLLICCCTICPARSYNCGDNPMKFVKHLVQSQGHDYEYFIKNLKEDKLSDYDRLMKSYDNFLDCTRATQTGYYKRSNPRPTNSPSDSSGADLQHNYFKESMKPSQMTPSHAQGAPPQSRFFRAVIHKMTPILMQTSENFMKNDYELESGNNLITDSQNESPEDNPLESREMSHTDSFPPVIKRQVVG